MVRHVILWNLIDDLEGDKLIEVKRGAKEKLEGLVGKIPGLLSMQINIDPLVTSNVDMMLDSSFEDFEALMNYTPHPEHVSVVERYVRPFIKVRTVIDYEV